MRRIIGFLMASINITHSLSHWSIGPAAILEKTRPGILSGIVYMTENARNGFF